MLNVVVPFIVLMVPYYR